MSAAAAAANEATCNMTYIYQYHSVLRRGDNSKESFFQDPINVPRRQQLNEEGIFGSGLLNTIGAEP